MSNPTVYKRNEFGLLQNVSYTFNEDGTVDWRSLITPKNLVINLGLTEKIEAQYGTKIENLSIEQIDDKYLLILLSGIKDLARIRGFQKVSYDLLTARNNFVSIKCNITWIGNYESDGQFVEFSDTADASQDNTTGFGQHFLTAIATNRAFVRCVKNFLGIHILGQDEIVKGLEEGTVQSKTERVSEVSSVVDPRNMLISLMEKANISFASLKKTCAAKGEIDTTKWNSVEDIPKGTIFYLIDRISKKNKSKGIEE